MTEGGLESGHLVVYQLSSIGNFSHEAFPMLPHNHSIT